MSAPIARRPGRAQRRRDRGFTLVEVIISLVLGAIIVGVTTSAMLTSMNAADSTVDQIEDSTDATLVSAYLIRDAQAAGGVDPASGAQAADVGVSIAATTAGWQGCGQAGTLVVRFSWYDRQVTSATPVVVTYALGAGGTLTRRVCERGTVVDVVIGSHVSAASAACAPVADCSGTPETVTLTLTGSGARAPLTSTLTASLRGDVQAPPTSTNSAPVPLLALGEAATACPNLTIAATSDGIGTVTVLGDAIIGDDCGSSPVAGDQTKLLPSGSTSLVHSVADPFAALVPPSASCPSSGTNPVVGSASTTGITVYPQAVTIASFDVVDFQPGVHVFCNGITVEADAIVSGTDVLWYVARGDVSVRRESQIELAAATTGPLAGVVLWDAATNGTVSIEAQGHVPTLRGVVYAPRSQVAFGGVSPIVVGGVIARSVGTATSSSIRLGTPIPYLAISPTTVPAAQQGVAYGPLTLTASGGTGTLAWTAAGLPGGMTLSTDGVLSGNPTELGSFEVTVTVSDATAAARSTTYLIDVRPQLLVTAPTSLPAGQRGLPYAGATGAATGGLPPYTWSATGLPDGLAASASGVIAGTASQSGSFSVVLTVRDSGGGAAAVTLPLTINAALAVSTPSLPAGTTGTAYTSTTLAAVGGTAPYTWSAAGLPPGLTVTSAGLLSGTPTAGGTYGVTVTVADAVGTHTTRTYNVVVASATTAIVPMAAAQSFQVLTEQAAAMSASDVQGAVAVGGNLSFATTQTFGSSGTSTFRPGSTGSYTSLAVGGYVVLDAPGASPVLTVANGFFHAGATTNSSMLTDATQAYLVPATNAVTTATPRLQVASGQTNLTTYPFVASPAFPFASAFAQFRARSAELAVLGPSSCSSIAAAAQSGTTLTLTSGKVNVWNTTVAQLSAIASLTTSVAVSATTPLVINVTDTGAVTLPSTAWAALTGATKSALIWNFPAATSVAASGTFSGTLYAPGAAVTLTNIALTGDVVAASLSVQSGSLSLAHFSGTIPCGSPVLSVSLPASLPAGTRAVGYPSTTLTAGGGVPGYSWSATGLPAGMALSAAGVLSGTPTTSGTATVVVTVTDVVGASTTRTYSLDVADAPSVTTPASLPSATVGAAYAPQTFAATGGTSPYTWSVSGQPSGMSFSTAGVLSGTPTAAGTVTLTLTVTDALGRTGTVTRSLVVQSATDAYGCPNAPIGWKAEYFKNMTLSGAPAMCRDDATIDFDWADRAPSTAVPRDYFSVRWTRTMWFDAGTYTYEKGSDDGMRVVVDGSTLIDDWVDHAYDGGRWSKNLTMTAGYHTIVVTMYERGGLARAWFHVEQQVAAACPANVTGWRGEYYRTRDLNGVTKLCRDDAAIDFDWASGSPGTGVPSDDFSVRWTRTATFEAGTYTFTKGSDDGMRVYIDGVTLIDDWVEQSYDGPVTTTHDMTAGSHTVVVEFYERGGLARATFSWTKVPTATCPTTINGWKGEYFANRTLSGSPSVCRDDASVAFNWGTGAPAVGMPADNFSVRWTRTSYFAPGWYLFTVGSDDGMRVYYDGVLVIDQWRDRSYTSSSSWSYVTGGWHTIVMQYYEAGGYAEATLVW